MKTIKEKLRLRLLCRIYMNLNMFFFNLCWIWSKKTTTVSSFYKENNFKPCLTKQFLFLNMFKLWCEWGNLRYVWKQKSCEGAMDKKIEQVLSILKTGSVFDC